MRLITRREDEDTKRLIRTLREQLADAQEEARVQASANSLIVQRQEAKEGTIAAARASLAEPYQQERAENKRLRATVERLQARLDDALGYTPEQSAAIESGTGEPRKAIRA